MPNLPDHVLVSAGGAFTQDTTSQPADVERILKLAADASPRSGLVVHFHGGLVDEKAGLKVAESLAPQYLDADAYPLFLVWQSGLLESLINNKQDLLRDPAFRELVKKVSEWVLKRIGGVVTLKGSGGAPVNVKRLRSEYDAWFDQQRGAPPVADDEVNGKMVTTKGAQNESEDALAAAIAAGLDQDPAFKRAVKEAFNAQLPLDAVTTKSAGSGKKADVLLLSKAARAELFTTQAAGTTKGGVLVWLNVARFVAKVVLAVLRRYSKGRDHGFYCTVVEEVLRAAYGNLIGSAIWNQMKKDTADSFQCGAQYCGHSVVQQLKALEDAGRRFNRLTLVGHSTGAIYICNFLDAMAAAGLNAKARVVFLAPAVTHRRFETALKVHAPRIEAFRMFAMRDNLECNDVMVPVLYTRSLLYFVSGLTEGDVVNGRWQGAFDQTLVGLERYLKGEVYGGEDFGDVAAVKEYLGSGQYRTVWSPAEDGEGRSSKAAKHGDFDNDEATMHSVQAFLRQ